ncbi:hypothetical protein [Micromonospora sp. KLBMP9576]|uniref:hypothetical protein n=1 Tax=Micromonospora sp. KLBMP9576 TaxID=3424769 RepID=UPI003D900DBE
MKRLWTPAWIARHVAMVVLVVGFLALGWWQVSRAAAGNAISWGYAVEWPIFAGFVVFVWWREVRLTLRPAPEDEPGATAGTRPAAATEATGTRPAVRRPVRVVRVPAAPAGGEDGDLAAYNHYLRWRNDNPGASSGDYPG